MLSFGNIGARLVSIVGISGLLTYALRKGIKLRFESHSELGVGAAQRVGSVDAIAEF
jgi:hypothetical protein